MLQLVPSQENMAKEKAFCGLIKIPTQMILNLSLPS